ncbi:MAG: hypothetical protein WC264_00430 [Candidatus Paceibacterota bacterium]|jgi:DNA-binding NarL/FixJ family response regulator
MEKIKILLVDTIISIRSGLITFLDQKHFEVITSNKKNFLNSYENKKPNIVIFELLSLENDKEKISTIRNDIITFPEMKFIVISIINDSKLGKYILEIGGRVVSKRDGFDKLLEVIVEVLKNNNHLPQQLDKIPNEKSFSFDSKKNRKTYTSEIKKEILCFICNGLNSKEIGEKVHKSPKTIDNIRSEMLEETKSKNMAQLAVWSIKTGIVKLDDLD